MAITIYLPRKSKYNVMCKCYADFAVLKFAIEKNPTEPLILFLYILNRINALELGNKYKCKLKYNPKIFH